MDYTEERESIQNSNSDLKFLLLDICVGGLYILFALLFHFLSLG